jgi:hypothetical protein
MKKIVNLLLVFCAVVLGSRAQAQLQAGIARVDITPKENLYMGGYDESCRQGKSEGADGKIYIRALAFANQAQRIVFVEADVVSLPPEDYLPLRKAIASQTGIPFENIMLGCVHNHAAPYPDEKNKIAEWSKQLNGKFVTAVKNALADLEPVKLGGGKGISQISMNRRKVMSDTISVLTFDENNSSQSYGKYKTDKPVLIHEMEGVVRLGNNPQGPVDPEVGVLRIDKLSGAPKAVMVNYACHGTSLGGRNNKINPEWNGYMLNYIEEKVPGITGIFIQGACGDINPRVVGGLDGYKDNPEKTKELGYEIGNEVVRVYSGIQASQPYSSQIKAVSQDIPLPKKYALVVADFRNPTLDVPTTAIRIGDFTWVTFPGELFHEIGQNVKALTHSQFAFFDGYCNGSLGYLPTQKSHSEGGYEPWSTKFDPVAEKIYLKGVEKLLKNLY